MRPPVYSLLAASAPVVAIVGDRIGAHGEVFAREVRPYVTWQSVSGGAEITLDRGRAPNDRVSVQVDFWHPTEAGLVTLVEAGRTALESACYVVGLVADEKDDATGLYRQSLQFDFILEPAP